MILSLVLRCQLKEQLFASPIKLYKYLFRECDKLPKEAQNFYKHTIRQSFKQHSNESDPERIRMIITKTLKDAEWIVNKYSGKNKS